VHLSVSKVSRLILSVALLALRYTSSVAAAPFDLAGPTLEVEVTRSGRTLPAAEVPNLASGDRIWMKADLPAGESARYLMVAVFLRGATNPPPEEWFFACETWTRRCAKEGLTLTVPQEAQQLLVFLAPQTGGAFRTLVDAVRGRPGAFVRTSQDLNQAALDHARLDAYLTAVRHLGEVDPSQLKEAAPLLARSLAIKVDEACLGKMPVLQAPCLAQGRESLILDDGHSASLAQALTSGPASDLAMEASFTPQLSYGYYSPYVASVLDIARIFDSFHTAHYQYIPALASQQGDQLVLTLNTPPSFHDPKSVLVVALQPVAAAQFPTLHLIDAREALCASKEPLVLPVEGDPVVFSTSYAHDVALHLKRKDGSTLELAARADAARGGFVVSGAAAVPKGSAELDSAALRGQWGFDRYEGPAVKLAYPQPQLVSLAPGDSPDLIVGRTNTLHLRADSSGCLEEITLIDAQGSSHKVEWKKTQPNALELALPMQEVPAGALSLRVKQFGRLEAQSLPLRAFAQAGHLESFTLHAGDTQGVLRGNRLDEVRQLAVAGVQFAPGTLSSRDGHDELLMLAQSGADTRALKPGTAQVTLADDRVFDIKFAIDSPRPSAVLVSKTVSLPSSSEANRIQLTNDSELPLTARLTFSLRAQSPVGFAPDEKLEVATTDGAFSALLAVGSDLLLESKQIAVVRLDPARTLGGSAFGPLQFRRIVQGVAGEWTALATLVRLPKLAGVDCPAPPEAACSLSGSELFLLDSVSADEDFAHATQVPDGFTAPALRIPHPQQGRLYVKLRDDPAVVNVAMLDVKTAQPAAAQDPSPHASVADASVTAATSPPLHAQP
jgi:hypothetical protein